MWFESLGSGENAAYLVGVAERAFAKRRVPESLAPKSALARDTVLVDNINWIGDAKSSVSGLNVYVKLRSTQKPVYGVLFRESKQKGRLVLEEEQFGISVGQAAVFYSSEDKRRVFGGGWIVGTEFSGKTNYN